MPLNGRIVILITPLLLGGCFFSSLAPASSSELPATFQPESYRVSYRELRSAQGYLSATPSHGEVPILVIPVTFSDYPCQTSPSGCDGLRSDIETSFFGNPEDTGWHSVRSFYQASSYGQLSFYGEVAPWYTPDVTIADLVAATDGASVLTSVMRPAITWYRETFLDDLTRFDSDEDGFIDAVYFIYSVPANTEEELFVDDNRVLWAYTSYDNGGVRNPARPGVFQFGWSSYDFMYKDGWYERDEAGRLLRDENDDPVFHPWTDEEGALSVDAHTFIHEIGHFLGMPDYYSYDAEVGDWGAIGGLDMMDYNIGDHNGFTKAVLGWLTPTIVNESATIELAPLVDAGAVAIIPITYNDTLLDEYLLIEYYAPTGLNLKDALQPFAGRYPRNFNVAGVKIYHIDARIGRYQLLDGHWIFAGYATEPHMRTANSYHALAHSNSASRSAVMHHKLIHMLEPDGRISFRHGSFATDASLFGAGSAFDNAHYPSFAFNQGGMFPFEIHIDELTETTATISIVRTSASL